MIEGPAGIGKSTVLRAIRDEAPPGIQTVAAVGSEIARNLSFGVALQLLAPALRESQARGGAPLEGAAGLARALFDPDPTAPARDEASLLHGLYWVVAQLAEDRPLALFVDDVHWADHASLRFLVYLAQRIDDLPVALVLAARTGEPQPPEHLLGAIGARSETERHALDALSPEAVAAIVRERMPAASAAWCAACHRLTGGNPYLVHELLAAAESGGIAPTDEGAVRLAGYAPERVRDWILTRLAPLAGSARKVAHAAAVLGPGARLAALAHLAGLPIDQAAAAADELAAAEVLRGGEPVEFMHPLLLATVYADIAPAQRGVLHGRAARLLAEAQHPQADIGSHLLSAPPEGSEWAVDRLRAAAAETSARGAPEPAVAFLRRALEEPPARELRAAVLVDLAEAEAAAGRPEAPARLEEALALTDGATEGVRILAGLGWMLHKAGRMEEAAATFERALLRLGDEGGRLRDQLLLGFIGSGWQVSGYASRVREEWTGLLERVDGFADPDPDLTAQLATLRLFHADDSRAVVEYARRALREGRLIEEQGADSLSIWHVVGCLAWSDELDEAEAAIAAASADAERRGQVLSLAQCSYARAWPRYWRGFVDDAVADAAAATEAWKGGWGYYLPAAVYWLVIGHIERGDLDAAAAALRLPDGGESWHGTTMYTLWRHAEASLSLANGDAEAALDQFLTAGRSATEEFMVINPAVMPWRSGAARAAAAAGRQDEAERLAGEEVDIARRFGARRPLGVALRAAGSVVRGERGLALVREARVVLEGSPSRLELIRALADEGALLRAAGSRREAREPLRRALDLVHDCPGAVATRERAYAELVAVGGRPRRAALSGNGSLTPTEQRVAKLAAAGLGNRAIAERLFVSAKTVEFHLSAAYRKLGIASRAELGTVLAPEPESPGCLPGAEGPGRAQDGSSATGRD